MIKIGNVTGFTKNYYDLDAWKEYKKLKVKGEDALTKEAYLDKATDEEIKKLDEDTAAFSDVANEKEDKEEAEEKNADETEYLQPNVIVSSKGENADDAITGAENFISIGDGNVLNTAGLQTFSTTLYNILLTAGIIVAVIIGLIIGIKFMIGSVEAKAEIKQLLVPYIVGCLVVFGAFGIWKIVVVILGQI